MKGLHLTGIGINGLHLQRIGMEIERIPLAVLQETGTIRSKGIFCLLIIESVLSLQHHLLERILQTHISEHFAKTAVPIVGDAVTR